MSTKDFEVHSRGEYARMTNAQKYMINEVKRLRKLVAAHEKLNDSLLRKLEQLRTIK